MNTDKLEKKINDAVPVEWYIGKILPKEEWEKETIC